MLQKIKLKNFQSHSDSILEFVSGVNIIIGPSDNGKSSIIRAIEWIRINRPRGTGFIKEGESKAKVVLETDRNIFERERDLKSTGYYKIDNDRFETMGSEVPNQVTNTLNLSDINIQSQLETHFLILDPPGKVSQYLNSITKLNRLTEAVDKLRSKKRDSQKELDSFLMEKQKVEIFLESGIIEKIQQLSWIYGEILKKTDEKNILIQKMTRVARALQQLKELEKQKIPEKEIIEFERIINKIEKIIKEKTDLESKILQMNALIVSLKKASDTYEMVEEKISRCEKEIIQVKRELITCPYCGQRLTDEAKRRLLK